ncbi:MAG: hypothetical protein ABIL58_16480 [Pseudomonadota bacterium]
MEDQDQVYRQLQQHLDRMPVGFPATRSGDELEILKHIFSAEEAARCGIRIQWEESRFGRG